MSRPPVRKTENVKTAPVIGVIGGVFDRMRGKRQGLSGGGRPAGRPGFAGAGAASGRPYGLAEHGRPCGPNSRLLQAGQPRRPRKKGLPKPGQYAILSIDANTEERSC